MQQIHGSLPRYLERWFSDFRVKGMHAVGGGMLQVPGNRVWNKGLI